MVPRLARCNHPNLMPRDAVVGSQHGARCAGGVAPQDVPHLLSGELGEIALLAAAPSAFARRGRTPDVAPTLPLRNVVHDAACEPQLTGQIDGSLAGMVAIPNLAGECCADGGPWRRLTARRRGPCPALRAHVRQVLSGRAGKEVRWPDANPVVAAVTDVQSIGEHAVFKEESHAMRVHGVWYHAPVPVPSPVTAAILGARPWPATVRRAVYFGPEALLEARWQIQVRHLHAIFSCRLAKAAGWAAAAALAYWALRQPS